MSSVQKLINQVNQAKHLIRGLLWLEGKHYRKWKKAEQHIKDLKKNKVIDSSE